MTKRLGQDTGRGAFARPAYAQARRRQVWGTVGLTLGFIVVLAFWAVVIFIALHFIGKYW